MNSNVTEIPFEALSKRCLKQKATGMFVTTGNVGVRDVGDAHIVQFKHHCNLEIKKMALNGCL